MQCLKDGFIQSSLKAVGPLLTGKARLIMNRFPFQVASLRTTVASNTCSFYAELALALGTSMDPFYETIVNNLLRMAGFTKKIIAQQSQQSLGVVIQHASPHPRTLLPLLLNMLQDKNVQTRVYGVNHVKDFLQVHGLRSKSYIESAGGFDIIEKLLKKAFSDPNPTVKESARALFWVFNRFWSDRATVILESLDATARKQLEKACPDPTVVSTLPPTTPTAKKSSVAAAIAASRAKAKAIATAPPTLRHQATSSSYAVRATSPPAKLYPTSPTSRSSEGRNTPSPSPRSPLSFRTSLGAPSQPRSRVLSNNATMLRSVSASATTAAHSRTPSDSVPTSPTDAMRQRASPPRTSLGSSPSRKLPARWVKQPTSQPSNGANGSRHANSRVDAVPVPIRKSSVGPMVDVEESLLLASQIPMPDESDEDDTSNLISFSTPYKLFPPPPPSMTSGPPTSPPQSVISTTNMASNASSDPPEKADEQSLPEEVLQTSAEQAPDTAQRLLELNNSEDESRQPSIPSLLLLGNSKARKPQTPAVPQIKTFAPPETPDSHAAAIFRRAALFKNSPANGAKPAPALLKPLRDQSHENGWWLKRASGMYLSYLTQCLDLTSCTAVDRYAPLKMMDVEDRVQEFQQHISALEDGTADIEALQKLAQICNTNPIPPDSASPLSSELGLPSVTSPFIAVTRSLPPLIPDMWRKDKSFERLFDGLMKYLEPPMVGILPYLHGHF